MKNNAVPLDPQNPQASLKKLERIYRLDKATLDILGQIIVHYPQVVEVYVDEAAALDQEHSPLDDLFTFGEGGDELILYSADGDTFIKAAVEMRMYLAGFETMIGDESFWKVEFAIGAWKPIRNRLLHDLGLPTASDALYVIGSPELEAEPQDHYNMLISTFNILVFHQMIRFAGRDDVRVHFPPEAHPKVVEVYYAMRHLIRSIAADLSIEDVDTFNERLRHKLQEIEDRYQPDRLPLPRMLTEEDNDILADIFGTDDHQEGFFVGRNNRESEVGRLPRHKPTGPSQQEVDAKLAQGPFASFIDNLFTD